MRSISKKTRCMIILGSLLLLVLFTGLSLTNHSAPAEGDPSPTPATQSANGAPLLKSGDTEGLILGAGVILFIILSGVVIQRTIMKDAEQ